MKKTLMLALLTLTAPAAFADDGGIVGIKVNEIRVSQTDGYDGDGKLKTIPVAKPNFQIEMNGKEASKLMQSLPPSLYVYASPQYPKFQKIYNANVRSLSIGATENQPSVMIDCLGGDLDMGEPKHVKFKPFRDGAHCTITVSDSYIDEEVQYTYKPGQFSCHQ